MTFTKGITEIYIISEYIHFNKIDENKLENYILKVDHDKPRLPYLEYHICDHCNLNCKGCTHFCPLIKEEKYADLNQFIADLKRLRELFRGSEVIRLLGGEPLLNSQLPEFVIAARAIFPDARISIVSNGLLFPKAPKKLFETMKVYDCWLDLSLYKPTIRMLDDINALCRKKEIKCFVDGFRNDFFKFCTSQGNEDIHRSHAMCKQNTCHFLKDGKLSVCPMPQVIKVFNDTYELGIQIDENDIIDIYNEELDGWEIMKRLKSPIPMCRYCKDYVEEFPWAIANKKPDKMDWLID